VPTNEVWLAKCYVEMDYGHSYIKHFHTFKIKRMATVENLRPMKQN